MSAEEIESSTRIKAMQLEHLETHRTAFTQWINYKLKDSKTDPIKDLFEDITDGVLLLRVLETLTGEKIGEPNRGSTRVHKIENVNKCLSYLDGKIKLGGTISAEDVVDGKTTLILGLLWSIVTKYHIQTIEIPITQTWKKTGKEALLHWSQEATQGYLFVDVKDFHRSWNHWAFNALFHAYKPNLFDYAALTSNAVVDNFSHAFEIGEKHFGVPRILQPEQIARKPEEKSVMIYIACCYDAMKDLKKQPALRNDKKLERNSSVNEIIKIFNKGKNNSTEISRSSSKEEINTTAVPKQEIVQQPQNEQKESEQSKGVSVPESIKQNSKPHFWSVSVNKLVQKLNSDNNSNKAEVAPVNADRKELSNVDLIEDTLKSEPPKPTQPDILVKTDSVDEEHQPSVTEIVDRFNNVIITNKIMQLTSSFSVSDDMNSMTDSAENEPDPPEEPVPVVDLVSEREIQRQKYREQAEEDFLRSTEELLTWAESIYSQMRTDYDINSVKEAEELWKKHKDLKKEIQSHMKAFQLAMDMGRMISRFNPTYSDKIYELNKEQSNLERRWKDVDLWLSQSVKLQQFYYQAQKIDTATEGHQHFLENRDLGNSPEEVEELLIKYHSFVNILSHQEQDLEVFNRLADALIAEKHHASQSINNTRNRVLQSRRAVKGLSQIRIHALKSSKNYFEFYSQADDFRHWLSGLLKRIEFQCAKDKDNRLVTNYDIFHRELMSNIEELRTVNVMGETIIAQDGYREASVKRILTDINHDWERLVDLVG